VRGKKKILALGSRSRVQFGKGPEKKNGGEKKNRVGGTLIPQQQKRRGGEKGNK